MFLNSVKLLLVVIVITSVECHILVDRAHLNQLQKQCEDAYTCFHDMVMVCGESIQMRRTFLDLCDLNEYSCEQNMVIITCLTTTASAHSETMKNEEECKVADLCVHDKVPMCGIDSCGEMRTFIDTCDMHEFNCDSKKDFKQRPIHECWVTCKRGRSFKKPEYRTDCNVNVKPNRL